MDKKEIEYNFTHDPPTIRKGAFNADEGILCFFSNDCIKLEDNKVKISYAIDIKQDNDLVVNIYVETIMWRVDGGNVEMKAMVSALISISDALNSHCAEWMKDNHSYVFKEPLPIPTKEEAENMITAHLSRQN